MKWVNEQIRSYGDEIAIIINDTIYSYRQLSDKIFEYYELINKIPSSRNKTIAILSDYSFESIALFFALVENNNIIVPITSITETELSDRIKISGSDYVIKIENKEISIENCTCDNNQNALIQHLQDNNLSGLILFSSGSTGAPKAMIHNLDNLIDSYKDKKGKKLTFLIFLMFDHIGGLNTLLNCIAMGVKMVFPTNRDPENICNLIEKHQINIIPTSPTFLNLVLISEAYKKYDLSSVKLVTYGTEAMPESLLHRLKEIFPTARFLQTFGTSETGIAKVSSKSSESTLLKFDDPNTEFKIVNQELWIKSRTQILGYLNSSMERFTDDGWFKTGDLVEETSDGFIKIIGRNQEVINVGGEKVLPSEIEALLFQMPEIIDCIAFSERNPITGQMVAVKVLFKENNITLQEAKQKVVAFCKGKIENYKIPAKVTLMQTSEYTERYKKKRLN